MYFTELINRIGYLSFAERQMEAELEQIRKRLRAAVDATNGVILSHVPTFRPLTVEQWSAVVLTKEIPDPDRGGN